MPDYVVPHTIESPRNEVRSIIRMSETLNAYGLLQQGITPMSEQGYPGYTSDATTSQGDHMRLSVATGNPSDGVSYESAPLVDIGSLAFANNPDGSYGVFEPVTNVDEASFHPANSQDAAVTVATSVTDVDADEGKVQANLVVDESSGDLVTQITYNPFPDGEPEPVYPPVYESWQEGAE